MRIETEQRARARTLTALLAGGDWATWDGDVRALSQVADLLEECVAEPLRSECRTLADCCRRDPGRAPLRWAHLRDGLRAELETAQR